MQILKRFNAWGGLRPLWLLKKSSWGLAPLAADKLHPWAGVEWGDNSLRAACGSREVGAHCLREWGWWEATTNSILN